MSIHRTAIIDPKAELDTGVSVGPYSIIEGPVHIGAGTEILSHVNIRGKCRIGKDCHIHMGTVLGHLPQDRNLKGEGGGLVIGDGNIFREYVTIHRSSSPEKETCIGNSNFLLGLSHLGHDCRIGEGNTIANGALLAGHVSVGDRAFISGNVVIHQFVRIGDMAMVAGLARVSKDVPPYCLVEGNSTIRGLNVVGMRRADLGPRQRSAVKAAFRTLYLSGLNVPNAIEACGKLPPSPELSKFVDFIVSSERGICGTRKNGCHR